MPVVAPRQAGARWTLATHRAAPHAATRAARAGGRRAQRSATSAGLELRLARRSSPPRRSRVRRPTQGGVCLHSHLTLPWRSL